VRLRLVPLGKAALRPDALRPQAADRPVLSEHAVALQQLHLAVQAVATQVEQPPAPLEDPALDSIVHLLRPVFGMSAEDEDTVGVQVESAVVQLRLGVEVVREALPLEPAEQAPLGGGDVAGSAALDRIGDSL